MSFDKTKIIGDEPAQLAIFDTETDMFVTSVWPEKFLNRILRLWQERHPDMNMTRFEFRERKYNAKPEDRQAILIVDKISTDVVAFFHWEHKQYATGWNKRQFFFVKYTAPEGMDITDVMSRRNLSRLDMKPWDGKGEIIDDL